MAFVLLRPTVGFVYRPVTSLTLFGAVVHSSAAGTLLQFQDGRIAHSTDRQGFDFGTDF